MPMTTKLRPTSGGPSASAWWLSGSSSSRRTCPIASASGHNWRETVCETMATASRALRSAAVKPRPRTRWTPSTPKYSDVTNCNLTVDFPAVPSASARRPPSTGGHDAATEATDDSLPTRSRIVARRCSLTTFTLTVSVVRIPESTLAAAHELRRKIAAQIRSRTDPVTCTMTKRVPGPAGTSITRNLAANGPHQFNARRLKRRGEREEQGGHQGARHQEKADAPIRRRHLQANVTEVGRERAGHRIDDTGEHEPRNAEGEHGRHKSEDQALDQQLADDAAPRRADRQPDTDLPLPGDRAREQQVGDVRTADHQDETERKEQRCEQQHRLHRQRDGARPRFEHEARRAPIAAAFSRPLRVPHEQLCECLTARYTRQQPPDDEEVSRVFR